MSTEGKPMDDIKLAKEWSSRMLLHDKQYQEWASDYSGRDDLGRCSEIWQVAPGAVADSPVGYMRVETFQALVRPWRWQWYNVHDNINTYTKPGQ